MQDGTQAVVQQPQAIQGGQVIQLGNPAAANTSLGNVEMLEEEPLYVNAKQYHRILKRRQARAKLEAEGRIPKEGKKLRILLPRAL